MESKKGVFFIVSCARSGSTSLAKIFSMASNGICAVEPMPNLNRETREIRDGLRSDAREILERTVFPRVREGLKKYEVYGEKNLTYGPFISELYRELKCRFIFLTRDGREVTRSLMDWHNRMFGNIYRECTDPGDLSVRAAKEIAGLPIESDTSDYSRLRPLADENFYKEWENFSREEMSAYYWSAINELYLTELEKLPRDSWIRLDYSGASPEKIMEAAAFCGLKGLSREMIQEKLESRINSLQDRTGEDSFYPAWKQWNVETTRNFFNIAASMMRRLEYSV